jgi:uncharacterized protein YecE (DUF72 family)
VGRIVVGTSSWSDPGFVEEWYPPDLAPRDRLAWYAERFEAVEVNSTFYAVPAAGTTARWVEQTPDDFTFDVKLHRLLSRHAAAPDSLPRALRDRADVGPRGKVKLDRRLECALADLILEATEPLRQGGRVSTFLLQLSPAFTPDDHRLDELAPLIERLAPTPAAVEFRHRAWVAQKRREGTLAWLEDHNAVYVCVDAPQGRAPTMMPPLDAATRHDVAYLRAHGRNAEGYMRGRTVAERFGHDYTDSELGELESRAGDLAAQTDTVRLMFNNNRGGDAPRAALRMRERLGQAAGAAA